ncbi:MAG: hypothetical protein K8S99_06490 [Planctomycetes bacterium]|nr:hypothetical protein [Planctomycetota bacterium]
MTSTELRDLVEKQLGRLWEEWSREHPHLAAAIDRVRLIESTVERLRDDPQFQQAVARAAADNTRLDAVEGVVGLIEGLISRVLRV